jgi:aminoglycoside phosphotransferase family enzyme/predicted kinase
LKRQPLPAKLAARLARPAAHPHDPAARQRGFRIEWVQTHLSHVFLTPERVYKLRKDVALGFVDFSTRARRNADCRNEVRLNRRLAPDVYLGIAPIEVRGRRAEIGPIGATCSPTHEHVVVMRRLPAGHDALSMLGRGEFGVEHVDAVAVRLARFHAAHGLGRPSPWSRAAWFAQLRRPVLDNLHLLEASAGRLFPRATWAGICAAERAFADAHRDTFEARRREGRAVEGHGDVHLQHVWFEDGRVEPTLIDCIEFNAALRRLDAAAEVAFLAMDLRYRGRARLAARFLQSYAEAADDHGLFEVVEYFVSYRAAVRAKVAAIAAGDANIGARQRAAAAHSVRAHMRLAARVLQPPEAGALVLLTGVVGTGKSSAAEVVATATGGVAIASDRLRKRLRGLPDDARDGATRGLYTKAAKNAVYDALLERAAPVLRAGRVAVLDATYERATHRDRARRRAAALGVPVCIVETRAPRATTLARLARRAAAGDSASDAGPARYDTSRAAFAPVRRARGVTHVVAHTARPGWRGHLRRAIALWLARARSRLGDRGRG